MNQKVHIVTKGDTRTRLGVALKQRDANNVLQPIDVTFLTVKFKMIREDGTEKRALTTANVTKVDAVNGKVSYDFQAADVDEIGTFYAWFVIVDDLGETDHFPFDGRSFVVSVVENEPAA